MKKKILIALLILLGAAVLVIVILLGQGKLFQGALYNLRPIYSSCKIEGSNFTSDKTEDCEQFYEKFQAGYFPDGEYTIFAGYTDKKLNNNIIPIKIKGKEMACTFTENGYKPQVQTFDPATPTITQNAEENQEIPIREDGTVVKINYLKNDQIYHYDDNICEAGFKGFFMDKDKNQLGTVKLDYNGFINSRPATNEILITNKIYYTNINNQTIKQIYPGNAYLSINAFDGAIFKFTIPCSSLIPKVTLPTLSVNKDTSIEFNGLTEEYVKACGNRLYLGLQNTNKYDDVQKIENLQLNGENPIYNLKLQDIYRLNDPNLIWPVTFKLNLHLRDRSDSNEIFTLGSGVLTVTDYASAENPNNSSTIPQTPLKNVAPIKDKMISPELQDTPEIKVKVRRAVLQ